MDQRKKPRKARVTPMSDEDGLYGMENPAFEMNDASKTPNKLNNLHDVYKAAKSTKNTLKHMKAISDAKVGASKWRSYVTTKRLLKHRTAIQNKDDRSKLVGGIGLDDMDDSSAETKDPDLIIRPVPPPKKDEKKMPSAMSKLLLQYFSRLGRITATEEKVDLDFVEDLIQGGADVNAVDKHRQTLMHEVSRCWHVDVARFLLDHGANINAQDKLGRTPLHVAAAVDYPEMVELLIKNGAEKEARTKEEMQTPVHYAAKNDACNSLKMLIKKGCLYKDVKDYKNRTPIHVAAALDRSETARLLLDLEAPVGESDRNGQHTLSWMITKMPPVAMDALNQFHSTDRPNRKQYFSLHLLVQDKEKDPNGMCPTPLAVAVRHKQFDLLMHNIFGRLLEIMWKRFARWRAWLNLILNFIYIVLWSIIGVLVEYDKRHIYTFPDDWWRIVILFTAVGFTVWQIAEEVLEFNRSKRVHMNWKTWREKDIEEDLKYCHERWPEEKTYLEKEMEQLDSQRVKYFSDYWNIFDWVVYVMLIISLVTHIVDVFHHSNELARAHIRIMAITLIFLWLRLMKCARAFALLGPFIVMLVHMLSDLLRFLFLYLEFFLPYLCAFYMIFGGDKSPDGEVANGNNTLVVEHYENFPAVMFGLFRLTLVDDYDYATMKAIDPIMAYLLVGSWLALSAILCLNLLIALLSDTFQRVYDNAQANARMQKAMSIMSFWEGMSSASRNKFLKMVADTCAPLIEDYDDDVTDVGEEDLKKVTIQIKEQLDEMEEQWKVKFGDHEDTYNDLLSDGAGSGGNTSGGGGSRLVSVEKFENEVEIMKEGIKELQVRQDDLAEQFKRDMNVIKSLLLDITGGGGEGGGGELEGQISPHRSRLDDFVDPSSPVGDFGSSSTSGKRKKRKKRSKQPLLIDPSFDTPTNSVTSTIPGAFSGPIVDVAMPDFAASIGYPQITQPADSFRSDVRLQRDSQLPDQDGSSAEC